MARHKKQSETLNQFFGKHDEVQISKKLVDKLIQFNMKYEEITKVILSHSERMFVDSRLITLEEHVESIKNRKKSEVEAFLSSLPAAEFNTYERGIKI